MADRGAGKAILTVGRVPDRVKLGLMLTKGSTSRVLAYFVDQEGADLFMDYIETTTNNQRSNTP